MPQSPLESFKLADPKLFTLPHLFCRNSNKEYGLDFPLVPTLASWTKLNASPVTLPTSLENVSKQNPFSGIGLSMSSFNP